MRSLRSQVAHVYDLLASYLDSRSNKRGTTALPHPAVRKREPAPALGR